MNLTKSVRELAANISTAPPDFDANDDVSEKYCVKYSVFLCPRHVMLTPGFSLVDGSHIFLHVLCSIS